MPLFQNPHGINIDREKNMNEATQQSHQQETPSRESAHDFALRRAAEQDANFKKLELEIGKVASRVEDVAGITGELGAHVLPDTSAKNPVARAIHFLDAKLTQAGPYLRVGAAAVAVGGASYGAVKGAQAGYRWMVKKTGPKMSASNG